MSYEDRVGRRGERGKGKGKRKKKSIIKNKKI